MRESQLLMQILHREKKGIPLRFSWGNILLKHESRRGFLLISSALVRQAEQSWKRKCDHITAQFTDFELFVRESLNTSENTQTLSDRSGLISFPGNAFIHFNDVCESQGCVGARLRASSSD